MKLSTDSAERKNTPIFSGVLNYFPLALAYVAKVSKAGNDKHNPGQPLHWARDKSTDHTDCIVRHLIDYDGVDPDDGLLHAGKLAWRALALLETELEKRAAPKATLSGLLEDVGVAEPQWDNFRTTDQYRVAWCQWRDRQLVRDARQQVGSEPASEHAEQRGDAGHRTE